MAFNYYSSDDSGAPVLNGQVGSLVTVLDACLVNGYGSKLGAGWTKPVANASNCGTYTQGSGITCSLFVNDNGVGGAGGAEAQVTGWEVITSINAGTVTGSNPFPTFAQSAIGIGSAGSAGAVVIRKSTAQTAVARTWKAYADSGSLYLFIKTGDSTFGQGYTGFFFGDFYSLRSGSIDAARCMIIGRGAASSSQITFEHLPGLSGANLATAKTGHYILRSYSNTGTSITAGKHGDGVKGDTGGLWGTIPYLNPVDNGAYLSPIWIVENATSTIRGRMRGFYQFCHATTSLADGQVFSGSADFPGRTFELVHPAVPTGSYFIEISDTLETN